jgi:hypothetical protein
MKRSVRFWDHVPPKSGRWVSICSVLNSWGGCGGGGIKREKREKRGEEEREGNGRDKSEGE